MINTENLTHLIQHKLPAELISFMQLAGEEAARMGFYLYLVGGVVRDLLLERSNLDLDLVLEGDAIKLAEELARLKNGKVIAHSRFNTAKIRWDKWSVDIATSRCEGYTRPGALPDVQPCDIKKDLFRRDFTINAMAVFLNPSQYGELIDLYQGRKDLENKYIRILHDNSFVDDATRIWRAVRYEQRLDFTIEPHTLALLKHDIPYLDAISSDRIRHELELCLEEDRPEKALLRAHKLGLLTKIYPQLEADEWTARKIAQARAMVQPYSPPEELFLAFLVYRLSLDDLANLITRLNFPRTIEHALQDTLKLKNELPVLAEPDLPPSRVYHSLHPYALTAILANMLAYGNPVVRQHIELYLNKLRHIQPVLTGDDLTGMGLASGPSIKEMLEQLREARLDGKVNSREEELKFIARSHNHR